MIEFEIAKKIVLDQLNSKYKVKEDTIVIRDEYTITSKYGWIFCYQSKLALEGFFRYRLLGNLPIFISRKTGKTCYIPSDFLATVDEFIEKVFKEEI